MARFKKGEGGRPKGARNKKTIVIERVYQRCAAKNFHPADVLIEIAMDIETASDIRLKACDSLLKYCEGIQPESKPIVPQTPEDSVDAAKAAMLELEIASTPLEPKPNAVA